MISSSVLLEQRLDACGPEQVKNATLQPLEMECDAGCPRDFERLDQSGYARRIHVGDCRQVDSKSIWWWARTAQHCQQLRTEIRRCLDTYPALQIHHGTLFIAVNDDLQIVRHSWISSNSVFFDRRMPAVVIARFR